MKTFFFFCILLGTLVLLSISGDQYWPVCDQTKLYALGEVDERFGLSHEDALAALNIAAHIWNDALDKELFSYHPDARFRVDFLYDERQQKTVVYDENERALQSLGIQLDEINTKHTQLHTQYEKRIAEYEKQVTSHNTTVKRWNTSGGAPQHIANRLQEQQKGLEAESSTLEALRLQLNQMAEEGSRLTEQYNQKVVAQNAVFDGEFEKGIYTGQGIEIYQFEDGADLIKLLAHELGHALRLDHSDDQSSIMYSHALVTKRNQQTLSESDIATVQKQCEASDLISTLSKLRSWLRERLPTGL